MHYKIFEINFKITSPPDEPAGVRLKSYGFLVKPETLLYVSQDMHSSGVLLTKSTIPPAALTCRTTSASSVATSSRRDTSPDVLLRPKK